MCFPGLRIPSGCDPSIAWSSHHTDKGLVSSQKYSLVQTRVTRDPEKEVLE